MKRVIPILAACLALWAGALPASAAESVVITTQDSLIEAAPAVRPYDIEYKAVNGREILMKRYELPTGAGTSGMFPGSVEHAGIEYRLVEALEKPQAPAKESKKAYMPVQITTDSNNKAEIFALLPTVREYEENGFTGQLFLDTAAIQTVPTGTSSYSYSTKTTKEYTGFDRADVSYIPKTLQGNSGALQLADVQWTSLASAEHGDSLLPANFTAVATYTGTASGTKATGYITTAAYTGEVYRETPGNSIYSVIYEAVPQAGIDPAVKIILTAMSGFLLGTGGYLLYTVFVSNATIKARRRYHV